MKKNGFIATSLIYSFFLIFITLFLAIIADYLQNKVLLNEIEKGIKSDINDSMGIRDFEVGDLIVFLDDCNTITFDPNKAYLVANTDILNNILVLYSYELCNTSTTTCDSDLSDDTLSILDNFDDIPYGNKNATYYDKLIYNFDKTASKTYKVDTVDYSVDDARTCISGSFNTNSGCSVSGSSNFIRLRVIKTISNRVTKCSNTEDDFMGAIYLQK